MKYTVTTKYEARKLSAKQFMEEWGNCSENYLPSYWGGYMFVENNGDTPTKLRYALDWIQAQRGNKKFFVLYPVDEDYHMTSD